MPPAARVTDMHVCPMVTVLVPHVGGPILPPGVPTVLIGFLPAATVSNMCTCVGPPDVIVKGSMGVKINYLPAARMGDTTAHGGTIILGEPTVMIGEVGGGGGGAAGAAAVSAGVSASGASDPDPAADSSSGANASEESQPAASDTDTVDQTVSSSSAAGATAASNPPTSADNATSPTRDGFSTQDDAAKGALTEANPQSVDANKEYGGLVYKSEDGTYGYTEPVQGTDQGFNPGQSHAPDGTTVVGDYHCHGDYSSMGPSGEAVRTSDPANDDFNSDHFSGPDKQGITSDGQGTPGYKGYLGTPSGTFRSYDAHTGEEGTLQ